MCRCIKFRWRFFPSTLSATPSDPIFSQVQPLAASSLILDIANVGAGLVAVGERGHALVYDGSWHQVATPVSSQLTKVFFLNEKRGWAVGHDATILHTQDGGQTWQKWGTGTKGIIMYLATAPSNPKMFYAVNRENAVFGSQDGGKTLKELV